jgi:integrase
VATTAIARGADIRTVASRLGHADPSVTLRIYAHAVEARDREVAALLGETLRPQPHAIEARDREAAALAPAGS